MSGIRENVARLLRELPPGVELLAAAKTRSPEEVLEAVDAGISLIGENYVQEAECACRLVGGRARWHYIGHLQRNKVKKAAVLFDLIQTVDSLALAVEIDRRCREISKVMPVLIEVNSGRERRKWGVYPGAAEELVREIATLPGIRVQGLMTMGPLVGDPEEARPYFVETRNLFDYLAGLDLPGVGMQYLSMGMTNSYLVAVEEGANIVRIGTGIFGARDR